MGTPALPRQSTSGGLVLLSCAQWGVGGVPHLEWVAAWVLLYSLTQGPGSLLDSCCECDFVVFLRGLDGFLISSFIFHES